MSLPILVLLHFLFQSCMFLFYEGNILNHTKKFSTLQKVCFLLFHLELLNEKHHQNQIVNSKKKYKKAKT